VVLAPIGFAGVVLVRVVILRTGRAAAAAALITTWLVVVVAFMVIGITDTFSLLPKGARPRPIESDLLRVACAVPIASAFWFKISGDAAAIWLDEPAH
jgi:hypothetical protein